MVDIPQDQLQTVDAVSPLSRDTGTFRRDTFIKNAILHGILALAAIVALLPFYWMTANSLMSLGETINRRWVPSLTMDADFGIAGIVTGNESTSLGYRPPIGSLWDEMRPLAESGRYDELAFLLDALSVSNPTATDELKAAFSDRASLVEQIDLAIATANSLDRTSISLDEDTENELLHIATIYSETAFGVPVHVNYIEAWDEANFSKYFLNSIIMTGLTILGLLLTSIPAAYAFARIDFIWRNTIFTLLLATLMIPESITMIPNFLIVRGEIVPLPVLTDTFPFISVEMGNSWVNTLAALTVPFMANAFSIFLLRQFYAKVPDELWDAARIDGCGHGRFMMQIATPIVRPAIVTVTLLAFINAWNAFLWPLIATTDDTWRPLMVGLWTFTSEAGPETQLLMAGSMIAILPMLILYFFAQKTFTEGIATSGLKG